MVSSKKAELREWSGLRAQLDPGGHKLGKKVRQIQYGRLSHG